MKSPKLAMPKSITLAFIALIGMAFTMSAQAAGTLSGTTISNRAQIDYSVGGVPQTLIESAPGPGNSTPDVGNGADTQFLVDNLVDLTVAEIGAAATSVNPGQADSVTEFTVTNDGNTAQDYALSPINLGLGTVVFGNLDTIQMNNLRAFVDDNTNGVYDVGVDVSTFIDELAPDATVTVFVVVDVPLGAANGDAGNVDLDATTHDGGTAGLPIGALTAESAGPDDPTLVEIVFGDAGEDGFESAQDSYLVVSSQLSISKGSVVVSDPINGTVNPFAIPGAVMEYTITVTNTGATNATAIRITDVIDANLAFETGTYNGGLADVEVTVGTQPAVYCTGDALDADTDGCGLTGATLEIAIPGVTVGTAPADNPAVFRFQVSIN